MNYDGKKRIDVEPQMPNADFDVGVFATRLLTFTRRMIKQGSFTKRAKHDQDVLAAMDTAREIMHLTFKANEMTRTKQLPQRLYFIREVIGELAYFDNLIYSFWEEHYISGDQWQEWSTQVRMLKGKVINWYNYCLR